MPNAAQDAEFQALWDKAMAAGREAGTRTVPHVMVVGEADGLSDRFKPGATLYRVPEGVCGFAWVNFKGNTAFGRWAKRTGKARTGTYGGLTYWVGDYGQSMERKEAHARAFAAVLTQNGITAYAESRMD